MAEMRNNRANIGLNVRNNRQNTDGVQSTSCCEIKKRLQMIDFALIDTALYLNAYPENTQALAHYHRLLEERESVARAVNEKCGPITAMNNVSRTDWNWISEPWPWQIEAN